MCLILAATAREIRDVLLDTTGLLQNIYRANSDGIGAMYTTSKNKLRTPKIVPQTQADAERFIRQLPSDDRPLALHWRYRTHGDTDLLNCHPYPIVEGVVHFMHNGVLSHGNKADATKSDTWHYAANVLTPQLAKYPDLYKLPAWLALVEEDIGSGNRFVFMDRTGELVIANKKTGIEHDGIWFSNTYAWSPELLIPGYTKPLRYSNWYGSADDMTGNWHGGSYSVTSRAGSRPAAVTTGYAQTGGYYNTAIVDDVWTAIQDGDADALAKLIDEWPVSTFNILFDGMGFFTLEMDSLSTEQQEVCALLEDADATELAKQCRGTTPLCQQIAEAACYFGDWIDLSPPDDEDEAVEVEPNVVAITGARSAAGDTTEAKGEVYAG